MDCHEVWYSTQGRHGMNPNALLTFHVVPPEGQNFHVTSEINQYLSDGLPEKLGQTFMAPK